MLQAILFDLDDTLLGNNIELFMQHYFKLLGEHAKSFMDGGQFLQELLICTRTMIVNQNTAVSNRDTFWQTFAQRNDLQNIDELEAYFTKFYQNQFPTLAQYTQRRENAAQLVQYCLDLGLQVVVATNPVFPQIAIEERLRWAGTAVNDFNFTLVTSYENMHSTKPNVSYYEEILDGIHCAPENGLMVGDSWENDIEPAAKAGLHTFWIAEKDAPLPNEIDYLSGQGSLNCLNSLLHSGWIHNN